MSLKSDNTGFSAHRHDSSSGVCSNKLHICVSELKLHNLFNSHQILFLSNFLAPICFVVSQTIQCQKTQNSPILFLFHHLTSNVEHSKLNLQECTTSCILLYGNSFLLSQHLRAFYLKSPSAEEIA